MITLQTNKDKRESKKRARDEQTNSLTSKKRIIFTFLRDKTIITHYPETTCNTTTLLGWIPLKVYRNNNTHQDKVECTLDVL